MKTQPSTVEAILRNNGGAIILTLILILYHLCKTYYNTITKKLYAKYYKYTSSDRTYIDISKDHTGSSTSEYLRIRHIGGTYVIIKSSSLASAIIRNSDNFEDASFCSRTFKLSLNILGIPVGDTKTFKKFLNIITTECKRTVETNAGKTQSSIRDTKFTSKTDRNTELLLSTALPSAKNVKSTLKECYSQSDLQQRPFTLMKVPTDTTTSDTLLMNSNNTLIASPSSNSNDHLYRSSFTFLKYCLKEMVVLLEAKSNRKDTIDLKPFCYRHVVNVLGVCVFGKSINEITSSACQFYRVCDDLTDILRDEQRSKIGQYFTQALRNIRSENEREKVQRVVQFFRTTVRECLEGRYEGDENCLLKGLIERCSSSCSDGQCNQKEIRDSISAFLIAFCLNVMEILGGALTLTMYQLAKRTELQERVRKHDKVTFDLEGIPDLSWSIIESPLLTDDVIEETLQTYAVDPIIRLASKSSYTSEETNLRLTPGTVVLLPLHLLRGSFIVHLETQSFNLFVDRFVRICLKASVTSLLQQYVFHVDHQWTDQDEGVTSCRFSALPRQILLTLSRLEKRGKTVIFEESLRTFHAMQNASIFSLRALFT